MVTDGISVLPQHECKSLQKMLHKETNWSSVMTPQYTNVIQATQKSALVDHLHPSEKPFFYHQRPICILDK